MTRRRFRLAGAVAVVACLAGRGSMVAAQGVEIAPFGGYRFGGDFFGIISGQPVDVNGAVSFGVVLDAPLSSGMQFEGLFTHQHADVVVPGGFFSPPTRWRMSVDHWQVGGLQEFSGGYLRPFLTGNLGLTRLGAEADSALRFTVGGGGGIKVFPTSHVGLRLDGRVFTTFVDTGASVVACSGQTCFLALHGRLVWQAEFTAGVVVKLSR
jgi:hypothetical protein